MIMAGRPSKKPKLRRHDARSDTQNSDAQRVQRHRVFSQQSSGVFALRTTYIPTAIGTAQEVAEPLLPNDSLADPWNEAEYDQPIIPCDDHSAPKNRQRLKTPGVSKIMSVSSTLADYCPG